MSEHEHLPPALQKRLKGFRAQTDSIGRSAATVTVFEDCVLKISPITTENRNALKMLGWLQGRLPVPKILYQEDRDGINYLLMSRVAGRMACDPLLMADSLQLTRLLAKALQTLWKVDITGCPSRQFLEHKLSLAAQFVEAGECDMEDAEPDTYGPGSFRDPEHLLSWLVDNKPEETPVLSHGDFCLPNVFFRDGQVSGYIDLDHCGISDPYQDIALCYRSLSHNFNGKYGHFPGYDPKMLFEALGMEPDMDRIRYYILLDELF